MENILLPNGALLQEQYEIKKHLLTMPTGNLYLAFDRKRTETHWLILECIRELQQGDHNDLLALGEFLAGFSHPKLGKCRGCFIESGRFYVIWEQITGLTLEQYVVMNTNPVAEEQALKWVLEMVGLLKSIHELSQPITVLDIHSSLVFFTVTSELKTTALPIDVLSSNDAIKTKHSVIREVNAIGRLLYLMLTRKIWNNDSISISKANPKVGPHIEEFVQRCLGLKLPCFHKLEELEKEINELIKTIQLMAVPKRAPWDEWEEEKRSKPKGDRYWGIIRYRKEFNVSLPAVLASILFFLFGGSFLFYYLFPAAPPPIPLPASGNKSTIQHNLTIKQNAAYPAPYQSKLAASVKQAKISSKKSEILPMLQTGNNGISSLQEKPVSSQDPFIDTIPRWTPPPGFNEKQKPLQDGNIEKN